MWQILVLQIVILFVIGLTDRRELHAQSVGKSPARSGLLLRKEIRTLSDAELEKVRVAFQKLQQDKGANGYQKLAGIHGIPDYMCDHGRYFLPWHRAYMYTFEQALRAQVPDVTLPFWDWTSQDSIANGLPIALTEKECMIGGKNVPNPLFSASIDPEGRMTIRRPGNPIELDGLRQNVLDILRDSTTYSDLNRNLYGPHGDLHTWVGGDMSNVPHAAYDPVFWFHHANVDRQWAQWQLGANNADPPAADLTHALKPFEKTVKDVIQYRTALNYDYEGITGVPPKTSVVTSDKQSGYAIKNFSYASPSSRIFLVLHGVKPSANSYHVRVFINQSEANLKTEIKANPNYATSFGIFGVGKQAEGHQAMTVHNRELNISKALQRLVKPNVMSDVVVTFVASNETGERVDAAILPIAGISLLAK